MESSTFLDFLTDTFGKKASRVFELKQDGVILHSQKIREYNETALKDLNDKCTGCSASQYRQDLPFWTGSHRNKPLMIISQDAGKGEEQGEFGTVFTMHQAYLDREGYIQSNRKHELYLRLLEEMTGQRDFFSCVYFTDVIKCAYSTDRRFDSRKCVCRKLVLDEIEQVNPKLLVLMGKAAQYRFEEMLKVTSRRAELVRDHEFDLSTAINSRQEVRASKYDFQGRCVFYIPHLNGNLHISREFTSRFHAFRSECLGAIRQQLERQPERLGPVNGVSK